jgi:coenzyme F420-0:L-glutamate ligase
MKITPYRTRLFREREDLFAFTIAHLPTPRNGAVVVVTSKIAALAEGRVARAAGRRAKAAVIRAESDWAIRTKYVWLTLKDGVLMASAGVDESNADGKLILLPEDSFRAAALLRKRLMAHWRLKRLGVLLTDSRTLPLRAGVTGTALGWAGFKGLRDYRGERDLFGRKFKFSRVNVADSLAAAAVLVMGEGRERTPLALIEDAPVEFAERVRKDEVRIDPADDMYRPFFMGLKRRR